MQIETKDSSCLALMKHLLITVSMKTLLIPSECVGVFLGNTIPSNEVAARSIWGFAGVETSGFEGQASSAVFASGNFSLSIRTKRGRILRCWTSLERNRSTLTEMSGGPVCVINEVWKPGRVRVLRPYTKYSPVLISQLPHLFKLLECNPLVLQFRRLQRHLGIPYRTLVKELKKCSFQLQWPATWGFMTDQKAP